jgi:hypothetical protein
VNTGREKVAQKKYPIKAVEDATCEYCLYGHVTNEKGVEVECRIEEFESFHPMNYYCGRGLWLVDIDGTIFNTELRFLYDLLEGSLSIMINKVREETHNEYDTSCL